eukprot:gene12726-6324_t
MSAAEEKPEGVAVDAIEAKLKEGLEATIARVTDTSAGRCGMSYDCYVVSPQFEGQNLLKRHRAVNKCIAEELKVIHAFTQKTLTPEEHEKAEAAKAAAPAE